MIEIPGYTLVRQLGRGGMGEVHLARQHSLGREVALKLLAPALAQDEAARDRFVREARIAANLHHPHIVPIYEVGVHDGTAYIAMEYEPGGTVSALAQQGIEPATALRIVRDVADALDYAHELGVVHRDVKPDNILRREKGLCLLSDFGIAHAVEAKTILTHEGASVGTPQYMSPEQLRGQPVDGRSDLYSLGVVLYQLLTGQLPFSAGDSWALGMQHINDPIPRLPAELVHLQGLIDSLMAKDPGARPKSGADVVARIDALLAGATPALTRPLQTLETAVPVSRRRAPWAIGATLALLALGAVAMWPSWRTRPATDAPGPADKSIAVLPFESLSEDKANAYFADGIQDEILTRLAKIGSLKVISRTSTRQYATKPGNLAEIAKQLGVANILEGTVQRAGDTVRINVQLIQAQSDNHLWAEVYDRKLTDVFGVESEVAKAIADTLQAKLTGSERQALAAGSTSNPEAYDAYLRARALESGSPYDVQRQVALVYARAVELDPQFALAWAHLAMVRSYLYFNADPDGNNGPDAIRQAADTALRLQPELGESLLAQGYYRYRVVRDYESALQQFGEASKRLPNNSEVFAAIAFVSRRVGRWDEALASLRRAVEIDPRNVGYFQTLGAGILQPLRRSAEARAALDQALQIVPSEPTTVAFKAQIYQSEGRLEEAHKLLDTLPADREHYWVGITRIQQLLFERRFDQVATLLDSIGANAGHSPDVLATYAIALGNAKRWSGNYAAARAAYQRAIQVIKPTPDAKIQIDNSGQPILLALAELGLGDRAAAMVQAQAAVEAYRNDAMVRLDAEIARAQIQAGFGDSDAAIAALPHLLEAPAGLTPALLRIDPYWDPLRNDPRFEQLLQDPPARKAGP